MKNIILIIISILFMALNSTAQSEDCCGNICDDTIISTGCPGGDININVSSEDCNNQALEIQGEVHPEGATVEVYNLTTEQVTCHGLPCVSWSLSPGTYDFRIRASTAPGCIDSTDISITIKDLANPACCSFSDGTCRTLTEYDCCVAGGSFEPNRTCNDEGECGSGSGSGSAEMIIEKHDDISYKALSVDIFPNPTDGTLNFDMKTPESNLAVIEIYNSLGEMIYKISPYVLKGDYKRQIQLPNDAPSGTYIVRVKVGQYTATQKVVVIK